ncbi:MAG: hypothetical protein PHD01_15885 [Geobacteraceae bacterium]|nr:hypothetical protein [Geobacteraceae bacterium]
MVRLLRRVFTGAIYHVTSRGNARTSIFLDDLDRNICLSVRGLSLRRLNMMFHAYCLMTNRFHLFVEALDANLSQAILMTR